ncbi:hypothetical protein GQ55_6G148400 [Panicum hallii var. hallii]|uniref:BTB domain-containing protein n=1 Tax=Panicum hallii var. hallii TaxID=1504633 RepID=A0A2T7D6A5_9POAL|nr:hypothetical protein GQ55_6G148400 [Panicum hallii var. hallii]
MALPGYLRGDRLVLECAVRLLEDSEELRAPAPPPSDLQRDLRRMLEGGAGADVTIVDAGGRHFRAHRCVLAARLPVLRAQLCGPMRNSREVIELPDDVAPEVFAAVLHFIYGDALPAPGRGEEADDARGAQRLLAAADLYALDGLSRACQDMLCRCVTPCTAADTYALADRLNMPRVKAAVVESLAVNADGMEAVKASAGFQQLDAEDAAALAEEMTSKVTTARHENPVRSSASREEMPVASLGLVVLVVIVPSVVFYFTH